MIVFLVKRLLNAIAVMLAVAFLAFMIFRFVGDPVELMLNEQASQAQRDELRIRLGLDKSFLIQFVTFLANAARGDFGISYRNQQDVFTLIIERIRALGMQGQVVVSHAFCLGSPDRDLVDPLIDEIARLDIGIMTTAPAARPAPPVKRLLERGVRVCSGSDGIRDTWGPYGNADMLERVMFVGLRNNFRRDEEVELAFHVCTQGGADVMRLDGYGLKIGAKADLVVVEGETITQAAVARPPRKLVIKAGNVVARDGVSIRQAP